MYQDTKKKGLKYADYKYSEIVGVKLMQKEKKIQISAKRQPKTE